MNKKERAKRINELLRIFRPEAECALLHGGDPWKLLVLGRLSAQCTDRRVNDISRELFSAFPTAADMAEAELCDIEKYIFSCGLYKTKAKSLRDFSRIIVESYGGRVPDNMDELLLLPGVGRKIANLILGDVYGRPSIVADTHCIRISHRLGLTKKAEPLCTERELSSLVPREDQVAFCHRIVDFGREICTARSPKCDICPMQRESLCPYYKKMQSL